jgi:hypothetical protein
MKRRLFSVGLVAALLSVFTFMPATTASAQKKGGGAGSAATTFPVSFVGTTAAGAVNFVGNFSIQKFDTVNNQLVAVGTLTGQVTGAVTGLVQNLAVTIPVLIGPSGAGAACEILHLELGPIDLNLLGLVVHVDQIVIDITAQPGPGNLLGNLLCAITGLLDNNGPLAIIEDLLNSLLDVLNWLG